MDLLDLPTSEPLLSEWVVAVLVVKFDEKYGQQICAEYPPSVLSSGVISDLKMMSMPECAQAEVCHNYKYMIRVRIKDHPTNPNTFYSCFTAFQQRRDSTSARGFFQQSVILVCKYPIQQLAYSILGRMLEVLEDIPQFRNKLAVVWPSSNGDSSAADARPVGAASGSGSSSAVACGDCSGTPSFILPDVMSIVEVAYQHFLQWPNLKEVFASVTDRSGACLDPKTKTGSGQNMVKYSLPFYGSIFSVNLPFTVFHPFSTLFTHTSTGSVCSIMEVFEPLGLLPHVFLLWECVMRGKDIVVYSPSAATCSAVVTTLLSLIAPPLHCFTGDVRPFISLYDSDTKVFAKHINKKYRDRYSGSGKSPLDGAEDHGAASCESRLPPFSIHCCDQYISNNGIFDSNKEPTADYTLPHTPNAVGGAAAAAVSAGQQVNADGHPRSSIIIGITNPFLLKDYNYVDVVLLLANPDYLPVPKSSLSLSGAVGSLKESLAGNLGQMKRRPSMKMFSDIFGAAAVSVTGVQQQQPASATPSFVYEQCTIPPSVVRIIDDSSSERHPKDAIIEHYYDKWVARGGLQGKVGGIICVRQYPTAGGGDSGSAFGAAPEVESFNISEDRSLLNQIGWYSSTSNDFLQEALEKRREKGLPPVALNSGHVYRPSVTPLASALTVIRSAVVPWDSDATGAGSQQQQRSIACARFDSDRYVIGNKLLKEAFRNLTLATLRPFSPFCSVDNDLLRAGGDSQQAAEVMEEEGCECVRKEVRSAPPSLPLPLPPDEATAAAADSPRSPAPTSEAESEKPSEESVFVDSSAAEMASSAFGTGSVSPVPPGALAEQTDKPSAPEAPTAPAEGGGDAVTLDASADTYRVYDVDAALANYQYLLPLWELPSPRVPAAQVITHTQVLAAMKRRALSKSIPSSYYDKNCPSALRRCTLAEYTEFLTDVSGTAHCHAYIQYKRNVIYRKIVQGLCDSYAQLTLTQVLFDYQTELERLAGVSEPSPELDVERFTADQVHALLGRMRRCWHLYSACLYPHADAFAWSVAGPVAAPGSTRTIGAGDEVAAGMQRHYAGVSALLIDLGR